MEYSPEEIADAIHTSIGFTPPSGYLGVFLDGEVPKFQVWSLINNEEIPAIPSRPEWTILGPFMVMPGEKPRYVVGVDFPKLPSGSWLAQCHIVASIYYVMKDGGRMLESYTCWIVSSSITLFEGGVIGQPEFVPTNDLSPGIKSLVITVINPFGVPISQFTSKNEFVVVPTLRERLSELKRLLAQKVEFRRDWGIHQSKWTFECVRLLFVLLAILLGGVLGEQYILFTSLLSFASLALLGAVVVKQGISNKREDWLTLLDQDSKIAGITINSGITLLLITVGAIVGSISGNLIIMLAPSIILAASYRAKFCC